jgi:hypothetical protein
VLYRNGVGYFERHGQFDGGGLEFTVRRRDVGDFLSSLTAVDRAAGTVRSVSFEIEEEEDEETTPPSRPVPMILPDGTVTVVPPMPPPDEDESEDDEVDVLLRLDGGDHDLVVSYVVAAPIWRPSYRVVLDDEGALLQAWAVVQNTSGEDWTNVALSLTTGAPIAFRSDLGTPITPERPFVTDHGEVVMAVPRSQTTIDTRPAAEPSPDAMDDAGAMDEEMSEESYGDMDARQRAPARPMARGAAAEAPAPQAPPPVSATEMERSVRAVAAVAQPQEGVTRYDFEHAVTVPHGGSTMVAILSTRVPGESAYLFSPDYGVPDSAVHPFRVARLENRTGAMLERGPVSVLQSGDFLGQGVIEQLARGANTFIPFALERSVIIERAISQDMIPGRLIRIQREQVTIEQLTSRRSRYTVRNGGEETRKVFIRHDRIAGATLHEPPEGVERTESAALVPVSVPQRGERVVTVEERTPVERTVYFASEEAGQAIGLYLEGAAVDAAQGPLLRRALELHRELAGVQEQLRALEAQRVDAERSANQTRENLEAIRRVGGADDLRNRLVRRLSELDRALEATTRDVVELRTRESELRVRLSEAISEVSLDLSEPRTATPTD